MSTIDRIRKLIALSGSTNEHEARSAAFLACKLIREGDFQVAPPASADPWTDAFREARWAARSPSAERAPPRRPAPDPRPRRRVPCELGHARRSGFCAVCGEEIEAGSDIASPILASDHALGIVHADCRARWTVPEG